MTGQAQWEHPQISYLTGVATRMMGVPAHVVEERVQMRKEAPRQPSLRAVKGVERIASYPWMFDTCVKPPM